MPTVNRDNKFYTPSFILPEEEVRLLRMQHFYAQNDDEMKRSHNERAIDLGEGLTKTIVTQLPSAAADVSTLCS